MTPLTCLARPAPVARLATVSALSLLSLLSGCAHVGDAGMRLMASSVGAVAVVQDTLLVGRVTLLTDRTGKVSLSMAVPAPALTQTEPALALQPSQPLPVPMAQVASPPQGPPAAQIPDVSGASQASLKPQASQAAQEPLTLQAPQAPQVPQAPQAPQVPQAPQAPQASQVPQGPQAPDAARLTCSGSLHYTATTTGVINLRCSDGTVEGLVFTALSATRGLAYGSTARGPISLVFGMANADALGVLTPPAGQRLVLSPEGQLHLRPQP